MIDSITINTVQYLLTTYEALLCYSISIKVRTQVLLAAKWYPQSPLRLEKVIKTLL